MLYFHSALLIHTDFSLCITKTLEEDCIRSNVDIPHIKNGALRKAVASIFAKRQRTSTQVDCYERIRA